MEYKLSLKAARVNANLQQKDVAKALGVSNKTISAWENGETAPRIDQFNALCAMYCVPVDAVFFSKNSSL